jgi:hypothetical protein
MVLPKYKNKEINYLKMFKIFLFILLKYIWSNTPGIHLTECDQNNKLNVLFYKINNTDTAVPPMIEGLECNKKCPEGQFITYDITSKNLTCQNCPVNTFSTGSQMRICGTKREWVNSFLTDLKNECFLTIGNEIKNENCTKWTPHETQSKLVSGNTDVIDAWYNGVLSYNVKLKNKGYVLIYNIGLFWIQEKNSKTARYV